MSDKPANTFTGKLSALWLLRRPDGITRRQDVEKAIRLGLPLWPDAVRMARLHHRSSDDLAGGMFYYVGKDFVDDTENGDDFMYHEYGRYHGISANDRIKIADNVDPTSSICEKTIARCSITGEDISHNCKLEQRLDNRSEIYEDISGSSLSRVSELRTSYHDLSNVVGPAAEIQPHTLLTSLTTIPNFDLLQILPGNDITANIFPLIMPINNNTFTSESSGPQILATPVNSTDIPVTYCNEKLSSKAYSATLEYPSDVLPLSVFPTSLLPPENVSSIPGEVPTMPLADSIKRLIYDGPRTDNPEPPDIDLRYMLQQDREREIRHFLNIVKNMEEDYTFCNADNAYTENNSDVTRIKDEIAVATSIKCDTENFETGSSVCVMSSCHPNSSDLERVSHGTGSSPTNRLLIDERSSEEQCITSMEEHISNPMATINNAEVNVTHKDTVPLLSNGYRGNTYTKKISCNNELSNLNVINNDVEPNYISEGVDDMDEIGEFIFAEISELRMAEGASPTGSHCSDESEKSLEVGVVLFFASSPDSHGDTALLGRDLLERAALTCSVVIESPVSLGNFFESTKQPLETLEVILEFTLDSCNVEVTRIIPERVFDQLLMNIKIVNLFQCVSKIAASTKPCDTSITNNSLAITSPLLSSIQLVQQLKDKITSIEIRPNAKIQWKRREKIGIEKNKLLDELTFIQDNFLASISTTCKNLIQPAEIEGMLFSNDFPYRSSESELSSMHHIELQDLSTRALLLEELIKTYEVPSENFQLKAKRKILLSRLHKFKPRIGKQTKSTNITECANDQRTILSNINVQNHLPSYCVTFDGNIEETIFYQEDSSTEDKQLSIGNHKFYSNSMKQRNGKQSKFDTYSLMFRSSYAQREYQENGCGLQMNSINDFQDYNISRSAEEKKRGRPRKRSYHEGTMDDKYVLIRKKKERKQSHGTSLKNMSSRVEIVMNDEVNCNGEQDDSEAKPNKDSMNPIIKIQSGRKRMNNQYDQTISAKRYLQNKEPDDIMRMLESGTMPNQAISTVLRSMETAVMADSTSCDRLQKGSQKIYTSEYIVDETVGTPLNDTVTLDLNMEKSITGSMSSENINDMYYRSLEDDHLSLACQSVPLGSPKIEQATPASSPLKHLPLNINDRSTLSNSLVPVHVLIPSICKSYLDEPSVAVVLDERTLLDKVLVDITAHFVVMKLDTNQCSEPFICSISNVHESVVANLRSSLIGEQIEGIAINIVINETREFSFDLAAFGELMVHLYQPSVPPLRDFHSSMFPSLLPPSFLSIFDRAPDIQYKQFDYQHLDALLMKKLKEIGFRALSSDPERVSITKISKFLDTISTTVHDTFNGLLEVPSLNKREIQNEKSLASDVLNILSSRYIESIMKITDSLYGITTQPETVTDQFALILSGWSSFIDQGGVLRVYIHIGSGRSHPSILRVASQWLNKIDMVLFRASTAVCDRSSMVAAELADARGVGVKLWTGLRQRQNTSMISTSNFPYNCEECNLYFSSEKYFSAHHLLLHSQPYECNKCCDMFHTQLGLQLHMVKYHKNYFIDNLA